MILHDRKSGFCFVIAGLVFATVGMWLMFRALFASEPASAEQGTTMLISDSPIRFKVILLVLDAYRLDYLNRAGLLKRYIEQHPHNSRFLNMKA